MFDFENNSFYNCGQKFFIISKDICNDLKEMRLSDKNNFTKTLVVEIGKLLEFSEKHEGFCCAVTKIKRGKERFFLFPVLFYKTVSGWVRVRIETTKCSRCDWHGRIANPTLPDLYETLDNRFELMKAASQMGAVLCPKCNNPLERHAIWIENN